jgi:hypothetical protein
MSLRFIDGVLTSRGRRIVIHVLCLFAPTAVAGCSSPEPQGGGQTGHDNYGCDETATVLASSDADSPLGFSADDMIVLAQGPFESPVHWLPAGEFATFGPEQGEGRITVSVSYAGGEIRFVESKPASNDSGQDIATINECHNRLEADVQMTLVTEGGALNEVVPAVLRATDPRWAKASASIDSAAIGGTFEATPKAGLTTSSVDIEAGFSTAGTSWGSVTGIFAMESNGAAGRGFASYARWPSASECEGDVVLPANATLLAFTAADVVELASSTAPAPLTWSGGGVSEIVTDVEMASDVVCVTLAANVAVSGPQLSFDARLLAVSADGRIDSSIPVLIHATADGAGELELVSVYSSGSPLTGVPPQEFASVYGVQGVDLDGYDKATLDLSSTFAPDGSGGMSASGRLAVFGLTIPSCVTDPPPPETNGGAGCEGIHSEEVASAEW